MWVLFQRRVADVLLQYTKIFRCVFFPEFFLGKRHIGGFTQCLPNPKATFLTGMVRCNMHGVCCIGGYRKSKVAGSAFPNGNPSWFQQQLCPKQDYSTKNVYKPHAPLTQMDRQNPGYSCCRKRVLSSDGSHGVKSTPTTATESRLVPCQP